MRVRVVGAGLAGTLLAWRLVTADRGVRVHLVTAPTVTDATTASLGAVRAYEPDPEQRRLAIDSLAELLASPTLRAWSGWRRAQFVSVRRRLDGLAVALAEIGSALPDAARLAGPGELADRGFAGLDEPVAAVVERLSGFVAPARLRDAALADAVRGGRVRVTPEEPGDGYDAVVFAAGAWTARTLAAAGLPAAGYRTRTIQYGVYPAAGRLPPQFVEEATGLYGRPTPDGRLLLGLPTTRWDVDPDRPSVDHELAAAATELAGRRFPALRLGAAQRFVAAADCFTERPLLTLRPVGDAAGGVHTFTGGSGAAVKTALAASAVAASQLLSR